MKKNNSLIWGLVLVVIGVILAINSLGICDINLFFSGWWTLFIIIPCFIGLLKDDKKVGSLIGLIVGILLLLACQDIIDFDLITKLIIPIIIVSFGLSLITKNVHNNDFDKSINEINSSSKPKEEYCSTFSAQEIKLDGEFKGTTINAIFGGVKLDLSDTDIKEDIVINVTAIFGGIDIIVPNNVSVKTKSNSIFGGVDNKVKNKSDKKDAVVYINASCLFGGVDVK